MTSYKEKMTNIVSITDTLAINRNKAISGILNVVEASDLSDLAKRKIREIVLDEINSLYNLSIKILTYVQEDDRL